MTDLGGLLLATLTYMGALFALAWWVERRRRRGQSLVERPWIYALSLAVYCTAWTFYGNVGIAATSGYQYLAIHVGGTLFAFTWGSLLRRLVRIKESFRVTSVPDLLSVRYGKSRSLAVLSVALIVLGILPYIGLQLRAIIASGLVLMKRDPEALNGPEGSALGAIVVLLMIGFTILFGLRRLDATERHPGIVAALSVDGVLKLGAFLALGVFVVYGLFGGVGFFFDRLEQAAPAALAGPQAWKLSTWIAHLLLGAPMVLLLPRQFQVAVVENSDEEHVRAAQWLLPLYLLLINLFVLPVAFGGLLLGLPSEQADTFVLRLPLEHGPAWLALLVFLGGFSAATGMIVVETMAISSMVSNHWVLPLLNRFGQKQARYVRRRLLPLRWMIAGGIVILGYLYMSSFAELPYLVRMGVPSFLAMFQFVPPLLGGLYWRRANRIGAFSGLSAGLLVWAYTIVLPVLVQFGWFSPELVAEGPFGLSWLRPEALFGIEGLDPVAHSLFWSVLLNAGSFIGGSLFFRQSAEEEVYAGQVVDVLSATLVPRAPGRLPPEIPSDRTRLRVQRLLGQYFDPGSAIQLTSRAFEEAGAKGEEMTVLQLSVLESVLERMLAGSIGVIQAHVVVSSGGLMEPGQREELSRIYAERLAELRLPLDQILGRIDYCRERQEEVEKLLVQEKQAHALLAEALKLRDEFLSVASHELKTPITPLKVEIQALKRMADKGMLTGELAARLLHHADRQLSRLTRLVESLLDVSRLNLGRFTLEPERVDLSELVEELVEQFRMDVDPARMSILAELEPGIIGNWDRLRLEQVATNLLTNAMKFGADKPVKVRVWRAGEHAYFQVSDEGIGIDKEHQEKIFQRFEQAVSAPHYGGLGLGLYIARQIIEAHHGSIRVESAPNAGASFTVELPIGEESAEATG